MSDQNAVPSAVDTACVECVRLRHWPCLQAIPTKPQAAKVLDAATTFIKQAKLPCDPSTDFEGAICLLKVLLALALLQPTPASAAEPQASQVHRTVSSPEFSMYKGCNAIS